MKKKKTLTFQAKEPKGGVVGRTAHAFLLQRAPPPQKVASSSLDQLYAFVRLSLLAADNPSQERLGDSY